MDIMSTSFKTDNTRLTKLEFLYMLKGPALTITSMKQSFKRTYPDSSTGECKVQYLNKVPTYQKEYDSIAFRNLKT